MDWIEELFGVSPDGGNGTLELVIYLAVAFVVVSLATFVLRKLPESKRERRR